MNKSFRTGILAGAVGLLSAVVSASNTTLVLNMRDARSAAVRPGYFHADLAKCRAYAEANKLPLVAIWSNGDFCAHCLAMEGGLASAPFTTWMKQSGIVFYFGVVDDGAYNYNGGTGPSPDGQEGYHGTSFYWCRNYNVGASYNFPYVRVYWPAGKVDNIYSGATVSGEGRLTSAFPCSKTDDSIKAMAEALRTVNFLELGDKGTYNPSGRFMVDFFSNPSTGVLRAFKPVPAYNGGEFDVYSAKQYPGAGLELEYGSGVTNLYISLKRAQNVASAASTNALLTVFPGKGATTNWIYWAKNQTSADVCVAIDPAALGTGPATNWIQQTLYSYNGKFGLHSTNYVACVKAVPNSPKNPYFIGEKPDLGYGEWTMDLDYALQRVASVNAGGGTRAYTLAVVGGSLWCPDCVNTDRYIFDRTEFHQWALSNHVALVAIDIPSYAANVETDVTEATKPCLLTRVGAVASDSYVKATGLGEAARYQSGAPYLSRHGVSPAQAAACLARNRELAADRFNKLVPTNPNRPGVPTIYVLRDDGSIAGRIAQFASTSPKAWSASYLKRLDELLAMVDEPDEELNDSGKTTPLTLASREKAGLTNTVSFADVADTFKIDAPLGTEVELRATGTASAKVIVSVLDGAAAEYPENAVVTAVTNSLSAGAVVSCTLPSSACYVRVEAADATYFSENKSGSTVATYVLASDSVLSADETYSEWKISDGIDTVKFNLTEGQTYKFTGIADDSEILDYDEETGVYTAKTSGRVTLKVVPNGAGELVFGFQKWVPGEIGFVITEKTVREKGDDETGDFTYEIAVRRTGGLSGKAAARIHLVEDETQAMTDDSTFEWNEEGSLFSWDEGATGSASVPVTIKGNTFADGTQRLVFALDLEDDSDAVLAEKAVKFTLTINDDDEACPGRLALTSFDTMDVPDSGVMVARGGDTVQVGVSRLSGADGVLAGCIKLDGSNRGTLTWSGRSADEKTLMVKLPAYSASKPNHVIELCSVDGSVIEPLAKKITVQLVPTSAPEFEEVELIIEAYCNVPFGEETVAVDADSLGDADPSTVSVKKFSGSLAPGLKWAFDADVGEVGGLVFSGTPTKAGIYTATYQVSAGGVAGMTVDVCVVVEDPTKPGDDDEPALNPYVAVTRTVNDILVVNSAGDRLVGLLTVTIPPSGRLSAKYRPVVGSPVSFLSQSWTSCDEGNYLAELDTVTMTEVPYELSVKAKTDGAVEVELSEDGAELVTIVPDSAWSASNPAKKWAGYYTVSMPVRESLLPNSAFAAGDAFATLRMTADAAANVGRMVFAGMLPNGKGFSGSAALQENGGNALLPVLKASDSDVVAGVFMLDDKTDTARKVYPAPGIYTYWTHVDRAASADYEQCFDVYGCKYDAGTDLVKCCTEAFATSQLKFFAMTDAVPDVEGFSLGSLAAWDAQKMGIVVEVGSIKPSSTAASSMTLSYNRSTGLVSGLVYLTAAGGRKTAAAYKGVVMPGWGTASCTSCSDPSTEAVKRPFVSGACWFDDVFNAPESVTFETRRGCAFSIGLEAGK